MCDCRMEKSEFLKLILQRQIDTLSSLSLKLTKLLLILHQGRIMRSMVIRMADRFLLVLIQDFCSVLLHISHVVMKREQENHIAFFLVGMANGYCTSFISTQQEWRGCFWDSPTWFSGFRYSASPTACGGLPLTIIKIYRELCNASNII